MLHESLLKELQLVIIEAREEKCFVLLFSIVQEEKRNTHICMCVCVVLFQGEAKYHNL